MALDLNKQFLILGVGITGDAVARFLLSRDAKIRVADSREDHPSVLSLQSDFPELDVSSGPFIDALLEKIDVLVINPGLSQQQEIVLSAIDQGIEVIGDIELFAQLVDCPVVAVTGTNGKSTVVSMITAMGVSSDKRVLCGGNIGEPALNLLSQNADVIVLELSSYQLETLTSLTPVAACILNVSEDHMDRYSDLSQYSAVKQRVYSGAACGVWLQQDPLTKPLAHLPVSIAVTDSTPSNGEFGVNDKWLCKSDERLFDLRELGAPGRHNELNACFAWALGEQVGLSAEAMANGLRGFKGLEHRTELVAEIAGVKYYNDSKGTNVGATLVALKSMPSKVVLLAGGDGKSQDFTPLLPALRNCARALVTYGADGDQVARMAGNALPVFSADSLESAVVIGSEQAQVGDCVLLSPACASFDMFQNYQQRGDAFVACVERLQA